MALMLQVGALKERTRHFARTDPRPRVLVRQKKKRTAMCIMDSHGVVRKRRFQIDMPALAGVVLNCFSQAHRLSLVFRETMARAGRATGLRRWCPYDLAAVGTT